MENEIKENTVLINFTSPKRGVDAKENAWSSAKTKIDNIINTYERQVALSENVFLFQLPNDLADFCTIVSLLQFPGVSYQVRYFGYENQWHYPT